ncbi:MAG: diacylglycerol kinase family lipid kinase [Blastocatellia bacterium]|nr:diacylglycerol kinase family lipid kinase [Blastocatellia bacterium]
MIFIVNPTAARGCGEREWASVRRELAARGPSFAERRTTRGGEATALAREALRAGEQALIAVGGDGTLNEVVNGYFDETGGAINPRAAIGLIPCGTGSDFRRTLGLNDRRTALQAIRGGRTASLDVMRVTLRDRDARPVQRHAINIVSFGLGGDSVALVDKWRGTWPRWIGGHPRFVLAALHGLFRYRNRRVELRLDETRELIIRSNFFLAANGRYAGGGMMLAPHARPDDGLLDVILTDDVGRGDILRELPRIRRGAHLAHPRVSEHKVACVSIDGDDPLAVDIDGEAAGFTPAVIAIHPAAIRFFVP